MLSYIHCAKCVGIQAVPVTVEIDITLGIGIHLVGLADAAVKESLLRTVTALQSRGFRIPGKKIVINLAPADVHKSGSGYDLPIAVGIIAASGQRELPELENYLIMGELGLDGSVRYTSGCLPVAELSAECGLKGCILPRESAVECAGFPFPGVYGAATLDDVLRILSGEEDVSDLKVRMSTAAQVTPATGDRIPDFSEIVGQDSAKRGVEVASAGSHNLLFLGPPGSGKSTLARAIAGILPPMTPEEALITSKIYSVSGLGGRNVLYKRPFRAPHISASRAAILGGGSGENVMPGEVSLATGGILFADEFCEAPKSTLEALRAPMEDRKVTISRLKSKIEYPASFMLVAASNPCPCGYWGEDGRCTCTPAARAAYIGKLSGPILDRIDIQLVIKQVQTSDLLGSHRGEPSAAIAERVKRARDIQTRRFAGSGIFNNAEMTARQLERFCPLSPECKSLLGKLIDSLGLSARAYTRIIRIARTIADLAAVESILPAHIAEAASYRFLDRRNIMDMA